MPLSLLSGLASFNAQRALELNELKLRQAMERLATGKRINRAMDDPAGLAISDRLRAEQVSAQQARRNALDATSLVNVAESSINEISNAIIRMRELAIQASSDTTGDSERAQLEYESNELRDEIDRIALSSRFGGVNLLDGTGGLLVFQVGPHNTDADRIIYDASLDVRQSTLVLGDVRLDDIDSARDSITTLDGATDQVNFARAKLGAMQQRLQITYNQLGDYEQALGEAGSRRRDADLPRETAELARALVLQRAGVAVLAQANSQPLVVLRLLD